MVSMCAQENKIPENESLLAARAANKDKRYADAEALMSKLTTSQPELLYTWIELGTAQKGLRKYAEAEHSFKVALGIAPADPKASQNGLILRPDVFADHTTATLSHLAFVSPGAVVTKAGTRTPEFLGVAYSSLGEIYARTGRIPEARAAFDAAASAFPAQAALFRRNETIFFFQEGISDAQLDAAQKGIVLDPGQAIFYYFKGQALVSKATIDPNTQKLVLPPDCAQAYSKYLELEPTGEFADDARNILTAAGLPIPANRKK